MSTKIIVLSDTHGDKRFLKEAVHLLKGKDLLIHLGDNYDDFLWLVNQTNIKGYAVKGNCDPYSNANEVEVIQIEGIKIMLTHGHNYGVKSGLLNLLYCGLEKDADIVLFGHTHVNHKEVSQEVTLLNPGSPVLPRGGTSSYGIITVDGRDFSCEIKK
ncbi:metallophosphoesterase [Proteinivorax hydrogeniformans]|uniref:Phosphoesterase n=1 Tax=Proteinivorax hydrogeniformans TaxID=1826727 RepID=A0AAU8HWF5_9FIRM